VLVAHADVGDVINWTPRQDVIMHFTEGRMEMIGPEDV